MSRRAAIPFAAGLAAAALAFVVVLLATGGGGGARSTAPAPPPRPGAAAGRVVFARMGCGSCHALAAAGSQGGIGPSLDDALPRHTAASLRAKIVTPGTASVMPQDFAQRMSSADLRALVDFLMAARGGAR